MTKPVWSHVLALSAWTLNIAHIINYREAQSIPDCIRYIIGVFCYNFKSQLRYIYIAHAQEFTLLIHCAESLRRSNVYIFCL